MSNKRKAIERAIADKCKSVEIGFRSLAFLLVLSLLTGIVLLVLGHPALLLGHAVGATVGVIWLAKEWSNVVTGPSVQPPVAKIECTWSDC
jgi:hypothetical protein